MTQKNQKIIKKPKMNLLRNQRMTIWIKEKIIKSLKKRRKKNNQNRLMNK